MSINLETETPAAKSGNDLISMIKALADGEKFKQDAFFFCGFPSEAPNEELMYACNNYVELAQKGEKDEAVTARLISELEKALGTDTGLKDNMNITSSKAEIEAILAMKSSL